MPLEILTMQDLLEFKTNMVQEINLMLNNHTLKAGKTLKSTEVCKMLRITPATLQNLRRNKTVHATKIGGTFYYLYDEIVQMLPHKRTG